MARTKSGEAEKKWRPHLEAWEASGLSLRAYALREGLNLASLASWKRRLRPAGPLTASFAPVVVESTPAKRGDAILELVVRGEMVLRIPADCDEATLGRVVRALAGAAR